MVLAVVVAAQVERSHQSLARPSTFERTCVHSVCVCACTCTCEACTLNNILGQIFYKPTKFNIDYYRTSTFLNLDVDTRFPVETQLDGFRKHGFEMPPSTGELMNLMADAQRRRLKAQRETDCFTNKNGDINLGKDGQMRRTDRYVHYAKTMQEAMLLETTHAPSRSRPDGYQHVPDVDEVDVEESNDYLSDNSTESDGSDASC